MKKTIRIFLIIIPVLLLGTLLFSWFFLGAVVRKGVEAFAPQITGTEVRLDSVRLSPLTGGGTVSGLWVGNPEGFRGDKAFYMGEISVRVSPVSLLSDRILIHRIYIHQPEFVYERRLTTSNINEILKHVESATGGTPSDPSAKPAKPVKFEITEVVIEGAKVGVGVGSNAVSVPMPGLVLRDIGKDKGGITADEATYEILRAVFAGVGSAVTSSAGGATDAVRRLFRERGDD